MTTVFSDSYREIDKWGKVWRFDWEEFHSGSDGDAVEVKVECGPCGLDLASDGLVVIHPDTVTSADDYSDPAGPGGFPGWVPVVSTRVLKALVSKPDTHITGYELDWLHRPFYVVPETTARHRLDIAGRIFRVFE
jgi:hypothetical protein